jgi:hypothetical protein
MQIHCVNYFDNSFPEENNQEFAKEENKTLNNPPAHVLKVYHLRPAASPQKVIKKIF